MKETLKAMGVGFAVPLICGVLLIAAATTAIAEEELSLRGVVMGMTQDQVKVTVTPKASTVFCNNDKGCAAQSWALGNANVSASFKFNEGKLYYIHISYKDYQGMSLLELISALEYKYGPGEAAQDSYDIYWRSKDGDEVLTANTNWKRVTLMSKSGFEAAMGAEGARQADSI